MKNFMQVEQALEKGAIGAYQKIEAGTVGDYKKIENAVTNGYKKIETGAVKGFSKIMDKFVEKLFMHEGETVADAKARLNDRTRNENK